jgi:UDP-glucose 4-epimerase
MSITFNLNSPRILVTGGAGYIGSHTCVALLQAGYRVVAIDNLSNSRLETIEKIARIAGKSLSFHMMDVRHEEALARLLAEYAIDATIHFAGVKAVADSVVRPLDYYSVNVQGSLALLRAMQEAGVRRFVFSSSATVYGEPRAVPIREDHPLDPVNPYGRSKLMVENALRDLASADPRWAIAGLRYFNPAGAHPSSLIGEDPLGIPNNLLPYVGQVMGGRLPALRVFGTDYATPDGTAIRDYIHVMDLADAHVLALAALFRAPGCTFANLGTGVGYSVLEVLAAYEAACNRRIPRVIAPRRAGDAEICCADPAFAQTWLGWRATRGLDAMCADAWRFQCAAGTTDQQIDTTYRDGQRNAALVSPAAPPPTQNSTAA